MRYVRILALVALCLAYAPTPALAVTGYDSAYSGESAFVTISPGQTLQFQVFFSNTGTLTWTKGGDTQVDLAACLADKVTCPAQDPSESTWNSGWISTTRYTTTTQATVAPGTLATFAYNIKAPSNAGAGVYRFNGDLVVSASGARIHPEGYYQDAQIEAIGNIPVPTPTPPPGSTPFPSAPPSQPPVQTPAPNPLLCFDGDNGICTLTSTGATLDNSEGPFSGVYYQTSTFTGKELAEVTNLSFNYTGEASGGSPRISVPIDDNNDGSLDGVTNGHAFISGDHCATPGLVSTSTCTIFYSGDPATSPGYVNWAAFAGAHPDWRIAATGDGDPTVPFVVADTQGMWNVSNVHLGE